MASLFLRAWPFPLPRIEWKRLPRKKRIIHLLERGLPRLTEEFPITRLALYGSVARDTATLESDIDILVTFREDARVSLLTLARLKQRLEDLLGHEVDLAEEAGLHPALREKVREEMIILWDETRVSSSRR